MSKVAFYTLGCKVNQYETEVMVELFKKSGYNVVDFSQEADIYIINTCTVTNLGDRKSRQIIRRAKKVNPESIVAVVGCYSQVAPEEVEKIEGVNIVLGTKERTKIVDIVDKYTDDRVNVNLVSNIMKQNEFEDMKIDSYMDKTRASIKIQEGCNEFCSYCIIPYARGPIRSKKEQDVISEVRELAENGYKEIILTGIHLTSYGMDLKDTDLLRVIKKIHNIDKIKRIRLGSLEPLYINKEFINEAKSLEKLCLHYHISLQSGCDETLQRMNRKYTTEEYKKIVNNLRESIKDVSVTTDVMVGFPRETDEEFNKTYNFINEVAFSKIHVFKYSKRKGTKAAEFIDQVSPQVKEERSKKLIELASKLENEFLNKNINKTLEVLFERSRYNTYEGLTPNYINVLVKSDKDIYNTIKKVRLLEVKKDNIIGEII
jgi:threonylcarbamoyladenosine tRNA methylthiotransferase MtaB